MRIRRPRMARARATQAVANSDRSDSGVNDHANPFACDRDPSDGHARPGPGRPPSNPSRSVRHHAVAQPIVRRYRADESSIRRATYNDLRLRTSIRRSRHTRALAARALQNVEEAVEGQF